MKKAAALVCLVAGVVGVEAFARSIMLEKNYGGVRANRRYETGFYRVYDAPVRTGYVTVEQRGTYCNLRIEAVEYLQFSGDYVNQAYPAGNGEWRIPRGDVHGINVVFTQSYWDNVDCDLKVYSSP